jgi:hypothetical protein
MTSLITRRRATSLEEMGRMQGAAFAPEEVGASIASYRPRPTDLIIAPFSKCGTTWLQQTFHTLRTRGDMDFEDISAVVPWIETARGCGLDLEAPQKAEPRGFKSHLAFDAVPKGAKYVVALRDPIDALVSMFNFMEGWFLEPGAVPFESFARMRMAGHGPDYWRHLITWWEQRDNPDVLLLSYEGMTADPEGHIRRLATFADIALDADLLALTLRNSSRAFMLEHKDRYEDPMMRRLSEVRCGLPLGSDSAKVRAAGTGFSRKSIDPALMTEIGAVWTARVAPATGFADYAALEAALRARG